MRCLRFTPIIVLQLTLCNVLQGAKWTYSGPEGEHHWSKHYPYCGGAFQSPIDIKSELLRFDPTLRPIEVQNYNLSPKEQLTLGNNGHSLQISLPSKMHISSLLHRYTAAQLHFHWGSSGRPAGSEHTVNSKQYAAEMHVVHYNSDKYPNISMAVDKSDGLAVLGVLIEIGEFNSAFDQFLKFINGIKYRDQKVQVSGFNIRTLLPARLDEYYRYDGSLTTPPCYPSVLWTVFRNPVAISQKQFFSLATALYSSYAQDSAAVPLHSNYRRPQPADSRVVLVSFKEVSKGHLGMLPNSRTLKRTPEDSHRHHAHDSVTISAACVKTNDLSWINTGLLVPIVVSSTVGFILIVSLMCCLLRQKRSAAEQNKSKTVGYNIGDRDEYGSRV